MIKNTVEYTPSEIIKVMEQGFGQIFKPFAKYRNEQLELWQKCISTISDSDVMNKLIFCNDVVRIPPVKVFISLHPEVLEHKKLTAYDKKFVGCFFSYIFTTIFSYKFKKQIGINNHYIKTALYFYDRQDDIIIIPDNVNRVTSIQVVKDKPTLKPIKQQTDKVEKKRNAEKVDK